MSNLVSTSPDQLSDTPGLDVAASSTKPGDTKLIRSTEVSPLVFSFCCLATVKLFISNEQPVR